MRRLLRGLVVAAAALAVTTPFAVTAAGIGSATDPRTEATPLRREGPPATPQAGSPVRLPLLFVENTGQTDPRVALYAKTPGGTAFFTESGITWGVLGGGRRYAVKLDFAAARAGVRPEGEDAAPTVVSYLKGPRAEWHAGNRTWKRLRYRDLWPGIDLVVEAGKAGIKSSYEVRPGADPSRIALDVRGAGDLSVDDQGRLVATTPLGDVVDDRPVAWQETPLGRVAVAAEFTVADRRAGFRVGAFDPSLPLVVDPSTVVYTAAFGGDGADFSRGIAADAEGAAYIAGRTVSDETTFPVHAGFDMTFGGGDATGKDDAFVAKISPAGDAIVYLTYLGGTKADIATDIVVNGAGDAFVSGFTASKDDFPVLVGPDLTFGGGFQDGFVAKLDRTGTSLVWAGYIGGASDPFGGDDQANGIDLDPVERVVVVGTTRATQTTFPTGGAFDATHNGGTDIYVAVVAADGSAFERAGFLGSAGNETGVGVAVGPGGIWVIGRTDSATFPAVVGPDLTFGGGEDAIVAKFDATGAVQWTGFWGGNLTDAGLGIDVDAAGNAYLSGYTSSSPAGGFPVVNAFDATPNGKLDACFARVPPDGTRFDISSYLGGPNSDFGVDAKVRDLGGGAVSLTLCGTCGAGFPVPEGDDSTTIGGEDFFLATFHLETDCGQCADYVSCDFFGTAADDSAEACAVAVSDEGDVWAFAVGATFSDDLTGIVSLGGPGEKPAGVLVGKVEVGAAGAPVQTSVFVPTSIQVVSAAPPTTKTLTVTGVLDFGVGGFDPQAAVTIRYRGFEVSAAPIAPLGPGLWFSTPTDGDVVVVLHLTPARSGHGSSRLDVELRMDGDLSDAFTPGESFDVTLAQTAAVSSRIEIPPSCAASPKRKCNPRKQTGRVLEPAVGPVGLLGVIDKLGKVRLKGGFRLGDVGTTSPAPDVSFQIGSNPLVELAGEDAKKQGSAWVYRGPGGGGAGATVRLDTVKKTMTIDARGVTFENLPAGANPVDVKVKVGTAEKAFRPVTNRIGKRIYW